LPELAADLVRRQLAVIVTSGGNNPSLAAKAAISTIPIVFNVGSDPVKVGLVASLARPGGNATGVNLFISELAEKRYRLLNDAIPAAASFAVLANPKFPPWLGKPRQRRYATVREGVGVPSAREPLIPQVFRRQLCRRCLSAATRGCAARSSTPHPSARRGGHPALRPRNERFAIWIRCRVKNGAEPCKVLRNAGADDRRVLADAGREHERI
jgi:ABC transporter substrate binding protein